MAIAATHALACGVLTGDSTGAVYRKQSVCAESVESPSHQRFAVSRDCDLGSVGSGRIVGDSDKGRAPAGWVPGSRQASGDRVGTAIWTREGRC